MSSCSCLVPGAETCPVPAADYDVFEDHQEHSPHNQDSLQQKLQSTRPQRRPDSALFLKFQWGLKI